MNILSVFIIGVIILLVAILLNYLAAVIGLTSWYEFLKDLKYPGLVNLAWLLILYPLCLGIIAFYSVKFLS